MFSAVLRTLLALTAAVALAAAPCRNCVPAASNAPAPQHDCCPKPKPPAPCHQQQPDCKWSPADTGLASDVKSSIQPDEAAAPLAFAIEADPVSHTQVPAAVRHHSSSPPGSTTSVLRI